MAQGKEGLSGGTSGPQGCFARRHRGRTWGSCLEGRDLCGRRSRGRYTEAGRIGDHRIAARDIGGRRTWRRYLIRGQGIGGPSVCGRCTEAYGIGDHGIAARDIGGRSGEGRFSPHSPAPR